MRAFIIVSIITFVWIIIYFLCYMRDKISRTIERPEDTWKCVQMEKLKRRNRQSSLAIVIKYLRRSYLASSIAFANSLSLLIQYQTICLLVFRRCQIKHSGNPILINLHISSTFLIIGSRLFLIFSPLLVHPEYKNPNNSFSCNYKVYTLIYTI